MTDPAFPSGVEEPVVERALWIVHFDDIDFVRAEPSPSGPDAIASTRVLDHAYVYVDAQTGAYLAARLVP